MEHGLLLSSHLQVAVQLNPWNQWLAMKSTYWHVWETLHLQFVRAGQISVGKIPWWHHQMETFSMLLALYAGNSPVTSESPSQRPVTWSFDVFFDLRLKKCLSKKSWGWWFEMPPCSLWGQCNAVNLHHVHWKPRVVMCPINCHNDNFWCYHWWWSWHRDKSDIQCIL